MLQRILTYITGIILFAIAGLVALPFMVDLDKYKNDFSSLIKNFTGVVPVIEGNISITLVPFPAIKLGRVSILNSEGTSSAAIFVADEVEVRFKISSFFKGGFDPSSIKLIRPRLELEKIGNDSNNWTKIYEQRHKLKVDKEHDIAVNITVENGVVVYRSDTLKTTVNNISSNIQIGSVDGPVKTEGNFLLDGMVLNFKANMESLAKNSAVEFHLASDSFALDMQGIYSFGDNFNIKGTSLLNVIDVHRFMDSFFANEPLFGQIKSSESASVKGDFLVSNDKISFNNIEIDSNSIKGSGNIDILYNSAEHEGVQWGINLNIDQINADSLHAQSIKNPIASDEFRYGNAGADSFNLAAYHFDLPVNISALISVSVGELIYHNDKISNIQIDTDFFNGKAIIHSFSADLPGKSKIELVGNIEHNGERPLFLGKIRAYGDNLRQVLIWLLPSYIFIPENELKEYLFSCDLNITPRKMSVSNIYGSFDRSLLSGSLFIRPTDGIPSIKADIKFDRFDFDKYNATKQIDQYIREFLLHAKDFDIETSWLKLITYKVSLSLSSDDIIYNHNNIKNISAAFGIAKGLMSVQSISFDSDMAKFQGKLILNFSKTTPEIKTDINAKYFDTAAFIIKDEIQKEAKDDKAPDAKTALPSMWSKDKFNMMGISRFTGALNLLCEVCKHDGIQLNNTALKGGLAKDVFTIDEFKSNFGEKGIINVNGGFGVSSESPSASLSVAASAINIHDLLTILGSKNNMQGTLYAGAAIKTFGLSPFEWVKELKGTAKVAMRDVEIEGIDIPMIIEQSRMLYSVIDMNTAIKTASTNGKTKFLAVDGRINADKSILQIKDMAIATESLRGVLVANTSLHNFKMNGLAKVNYIPESGKKVTLNFELGGIVPDDVNYKLDSSNLEQYITGKANR